MVDGRGKAIGGSMLLAGTGHITHRRCLHFIILSCFGTGILRQCSLLCCFLCRAYSGCCCCFSRCCCCGCCGLSCCRRFLCCRCCCLSCCCCSSFAWALLVGCLHQILGPDACKRWSTNDGISCAGQRLQVARKGGEMARGALQSGGSGSRASLPAPCATPSAR